MKTEEERIITWLNRLAPENQVMNKILGSVAVDLAWSIKTRPLEKIEDLVAHLVSLGHGPESSRELAKETLGVAYDEMLELEEAKLNARLDRHAKRTTNRALYVREPVFSAYEYDDGETTRLRWRFDRELRCRGLISNIVEVLHGLQTEPVSMNILRNFDPREQEDLVPHWKQSLNEFNTLGVAVSGERLAWNQNSPGWQILQKCFPKGIDLSAYGHGVNAPLMAKGFLQNVTVNLKVLRDVAGIDLQTDGSGIYNPTCPAMAEWVAKYGAVPVQFRLVEPVSGLFGKGVLFPSEQATSIDLDWGQIKGRWKALAKERRAANETKTVSGCFVGLLQAWDRPRRISSSFEMLENVQVNPKTAQIVRTLVTRAMNRLFAKGVDGLVHAVAKKDPTIKLMVQLVDVLRAQGTNIQYVDIPRIHQAVKDKLGRVLYRISQGGGMKLPSYVTRLDSTVAPGTCVVSGMEAGLRVAGFRFPMILSQGLLVMTTTDPPPHHLVNGELSPNTVVMNPRDLVLGMQGDDDGDIIGLTSNKEIVALFEQRLDEQLYHIEPKGVEIMGSDGTPMKSNTAEGLQYLQTDHRGPVGRVTVWRSRMLAIGANNEARALSIAIQENIDKHKRKPEWSNIEKASNPMLWVQNPDGTYSFNIRYSDAELEDQDFPLQRLKEWVDSKLIEAGCLYFDDEVKAADPLWWRVPGKKIDVDNWSVPEVSKFENLVHISARRCFELWEQNGKILMTPNASLDLGMVLRAALATKIELPRTQALSEHEYENLRIRAGLTDYNKKLSKIQSSRRSEEGETLRIGALNEEQNELHKALQKLVEELGIVPLIQLWEGEIQNERLNDAFRVIAWPGSPVLEALGIEQSVSCQFLNRNDRLAKTIKLCLADQDPSTKLRVLIKNSTKHELEEQDEQGAPIALHQCEECMNLLQNELVSALRTARASHEQKWLMKLNRELNQLIKSA